MALHDHTLGSSFRGGHRPEEGVIHGELFILPGRTAVKSVADISLTATESDSREMVSDIRRQDSRMSRVELYDRTYHASL